LTVFSLYYPIHETEKQTYKPQNMSPLTQRTDKQLSNGYYDPQGATLHPNGVNFALYSKYAESVYLLLFDSVDGEPTDIIPVYSKTKNVWHVFIHGIQSGQLYGYKVRGKYNPMIGYRFNENKLLIDPYAKAVTGKCNYHDNLIYGYIHDSRHRDLLLDSRDSTPAVGKSIVIDEPFDWEEDRSPGIPPEKLIIYEAHIKGFTTHTSSGVRNPGTYSGLIEKIPYLKDLGINAIELMPVHEHFSPAELIKKGLKEYWGYNTIGFFAPESSFRSDPALGSQVNEFKNMVKSLHKAGLEVILDVVYNHTGEGGETGPTICFRGIDNQSYYALEGPSLQPYRHYRNDTGTGNMLNVENPQVRKLILDSLRYWVLEMHVDGFRFDLATILARKKGRFSQKSVLMKLIARDPVLKKVKLIAEPWDLSTYQLGSFPKNWHEWNGKYRDTLRRFLKGDQGQLNDLGWRLTGSMDLFNNRHRKPYHSINFITCHDGFTLHDLFSYNTKHNEANHEENRDGSNDNHSWNCGFEGFTDNSPVLNLRKRMIKNAICCLLFSTGTPMIRSGDEIMKSQNGNNNAYCQDNEISWLDWNLLENNRDIYQFFKMAVALRKSLPVFQRTSFLNGRDSSGNSVPDISWFGPQAGQPPWNKPDLKTIACLLDGAEVSPGSKDRIFLILNSDPASRHISLPKQPGPWHRLIDTALDHDAICLPDESRPIPSQELYSVQPRSVVLLWTGE